MGLSGDLGGGKGVKWDEKGYDEFGREVECGVMMTVLL